MLLAFHIFGGLLTVPVIILAAIATYRLYKNTKSFKVLLRLLATFQIFSGVLLLFVSSTSTARLCVSSGAYLLLIGAFEFWAYKYEHRLISEKVRVDTAH